MSGSVMTDQLRSDGSLRHLLTLEGLARTQIERLLERSQGFVRPLGVTPATGRSLSGATVAHLSTERCNRTRAMFDLATKLVVVQLFMLEVLVSSSVHGA